MRKFVIKNADGSEQTVMRAIHNSRKEAGETLMDYICDQKNFLNIDDDDYLSPFDFTLEEVECAEVNERITDFDKATKALGIKPNADFYVVKRNRSEKVANLENAARLALLGNVARLVTDINPKHMKALVALNKLFTIAQAWNKEDDFIPDFSDCGQKKWFPWFAYEKATKRFVFSSTAYAPASAFANFGSRLCFKTSERAAQFGKQFVDLYNKVFL